MGECFKYTTQLTKVLRKAAEGESISIAFLGGSITQGCSPTDPKNAYVERVITWFENKWPQVEVKKINAGVGATGSLIGVHRMNRDIIQYQPDLVFVEFAANDIPPKTQTHLSYEGIIRKLVKNLKETAVVALFMTTDDGTSAEAEQTKIVDYYQLPRVSYREEVLKQIKLGTYTWQDIAVDEVHPNDRGHGILAGLITHLLEYALQQEVSNELYIMPEKPLYTKQYDECQLVEFQAITPLEETGFRFVKQSFRTLNTGYEAEEKADKVYFKWEVEARNIYLLYVRGIELDRAKMQIKVNGQQLADVDTFFKDGWGNYGDTVALVVGNEKMTYTIEVSLAQEEVGKKLTLLGFLVS